MSKTVEVRVPDIGDFKNVPVIEVLVKPGDAVKKEDPLVTLESDKATMDIPSPYGGVVKALKVKVGDKVSEGTAVLAIDVNEETAAAPAPSRQPHSTGSGQVSPSSGESKGAGVTPDPAQKVVPPPPTLPAIETRG